MFDYISVCVNSSLTLVLLKNTSSKADQGDMITPLYNIRPQDIENSPLLSMEFRIRILEYPYTGEIINTGQAE